MLPLQLQAFQSLDIPSQLHQTLRQVWYLQHHSHPGRTMVKCWANIKDTEWNQGRNFRKHKGISLNKKLMFDMREKCSLYLKGREKRRRRVRTTWKWCGLSHTNFDMTMDFMFYFSWYIFWQTPDMLPRLVPDNQINYTQERAIMNLARE